ncbi:interferon gamma receptor 1 isoform X2 [Colossoma macropomum]|uniref:interferon gamma receptor 1 isoform X2 n=1 Tax=Colossoma macropomum TaxID=42526 RepID=UPI00186459B2|nr:interferon gamma receptor 1 isoform X2 [Colossoma macropomum]
MRAELSGVTVFTALLLSGLTVGSSFALPAPSNVTITCDSYGVVVAWTSSGLSENASFTLRLISNNPSPDIFINTSSHQCNISELLQDTGFNHYLVEVKARDGEYESPSADSKKFSFNLLQNADIHCNLTFPPVDLIPGERQLFFRFSNPLQVYRHTPALRNLTAAENLRYSVFNKEARTERTEYTNFIPQFECTPESKTCEGNVSFPEEQEEYCVELSGFIRQTKLEETKHLCYRGSLRPSVPIPIYLIPLFIFLACCALSLAFFLAKVINRKMKERSLSNLPGFLDKIPNLIKPLIPDPECVEKYLQVTPVTIIPNNDDISRSSSPPDPRPRYSFGQDDFRKEPEGGEVEENHTGPYGNGAEMSTGGLSSGYDRPHALIEISPGDTVDAYTTRRAL